MENEKTPRMEELESGQQEMQEKISRATKMVINLTKGRGTTDDLEEPASRKDDISPFIVPNLNNPCEQESFRKKFVWTVKPCRHAAKVQSPRQEAERD